MGAVESMMDGRGAIETRFVWGTFRNIPHAYREYVYSKDVSTIMWVTLCKRKLTPKGAVTKVLAEPPLGACFNCRAVARAHEMAAADIDDADCRDCIYGETIVIDDIPHRTISKMCDRCADESVRAVDFLLRHRRKGSPT